VLGKNAHAWPEVWFDGIGWVPFEPTPGRGAPGAEAYTGLQAAQDDAAPQPGTEAPAEGETPAPVASTPIVELPPPIDEPGALDPTPVPRIVHAVPERGTSWGTVLAVVVVLGLLLATPALVRRWRRRHPGSDVPHQIVGLWRRALGAVEATGLRVDPALTPLEQARAIAPRLPVAARPLKSLADVTTAATFAPPDELSSLVAPPTAGEPGPRRWCRQIERIAEDSMTARGRIRRYFTVWQ
jgi:hypothetical protein